MDRVTAAAGCAKCGSTDIPIIGHEPCPGPAPIAICRDWESEMIAREYLPRGVGMTSDKMTCGYEWTDYLGDEDHRCFLLEFHPMPHMCQCRHDNVGRYHNLKVGRVNEKPGSA